MLRIREAPRPAFPSIAARREQSMVHCPSTINLLPISVPTAAFLLVSLAFCVGAPPVVQAEGPPVTYSAQTDGFCGGGPCNNPATWMTGSNGDWSFSAQFPAATYTWSQQICCDCDGGSYWTFAYTYGNSGGTFTLSGPGGQVFSGDFEHPGTFAVAWGQGLSAYGTCHGILYTLSLASFFKGQWNDGTKEAGALGFNGSVLLSPAGQSRTPAVGSGTATITFVQK